MSTPETTTRASHRLTTDLDGRTGSTRPVPRFLGDLPAAGRPCLLMYLAARLCLPVAHAHAPSPG